MTSDCEHLFPQLTHKGCPHCEWLLEQYREATREYNRPENAPG